MAQGRTDKLIKNSKFAVANQVITLLAKFVVRTVFVYTLGAQYLGVNGLFTNILSVLNLAELGIGVSIMYSLYKPLAENDTAEIKKYIHAFRSIYAVIGFVIFAAGMCLLPFLHLLIKDAPNVGNLKLIYIMYLVDSASSYFYAHYRSLAQADQRGYIDSVNRLRFTVIQSVAQILILWLLKNFYLYLLINILTHWVSGFAVARKINSLYPFLKEKTDNKLPAAKLRELGKNSLAMFGHRIGYTVLNSTDNIILSIFIGSLAVGYYSNYLMLLTAFTGMMAIITSAVQASVGNVCASESSEAQKSTFNKINFTFFWIYGIMLTGFIFVGTPFVKLWLGNDYVLPQNVLTVVYINAFFQGVRTAVVLYTTALGLFYKMRFKPIAEVIINIGVSVVLVKSIGMIGVFLGTFVSFALTSLWYEPYTLFKYHYKSGLLKYFLNCIRYGCIIAAGILLNWLIYRFVALPAVLNIAARCITCVLIPSLLFFIFYRKTEEFEYIKNIFVKKLLKKGR